MQFNPITKELFTDKNEFVKKMHCPFNQKWDSMADKHTSYRLCVICEHKVVDTSFLSDEQLLEMVRQNPATCLKVHLSQQNLKIKTNGMVEKK